MGYRGHRGKGCRERDKGHRDTGDKGHRERNTGDIRMQGKGHRDTGDTVSLSFPCVPCPFPCIPFHCVPCVP